MEMESASFISAVPRAGPEAAGAGAQEGRAAPRRRTCAAMRSGQSPKCSARRQRRRKNNGFTLELARARPGIGQRAEVGDGRRQDQGGRAGRGQHAGRRAAGRRSATSRRRGGGEAERRRSPRGRSKRSANTPPRRISRSSAETPKPSRTIAAPSSSIRSSVAPIRGSPSARSGSATRTRPSPPGRRRCRSPMAADRPEKYPRRSATTTSASPKTTRRRSSSSARWSPPIRPTMRASATWGCRHLPARLHQGDRQREAGGVDQPQEHPAAQQSRAVCVMPGDFATPPPPRPGA